MLGVLRAWRAGAAWACALLRSVLLRRVLLAARLLLRRREASQLKRFLVVHLQSVQRLL